MQLISVDRSENFDIDDLRKHLAPIQGIKDAVYINVSVKPL